jgi:hypothetical protein
VTRLLCVATDIADGFRAGCEMLLYGHVYPRHYVIEVPKAKEN